MNVHKRQKKPSFLKVFERNDEKEDISLLHSSSVSLFSATASSEELDLPPLFSNSLLTTAEEANEDEEHEDFEEAFVVSKYDDDDDDSVSKGHAKADTTRSSALLEEDPPETTNRRSNSDSHVQLQRKKDDEMANAATQSFRASEGSLPDSRMDSQMFSEHSESSTKDDETVQIGPLDGHADMVIDNSGQVPDSLIKHAKASAAAAANAKPKEKRGTSRLLSGAKGLLRVGKASVSPKAPKVELEAAVRKVSAGESAKSFAQFSLEEITPGAGGATQTPTTTGILTTSEFLDNNESDGDSDRNLTRPKLQTASANKIASTLLAPSSRNLTSLSNLDDLSSEDEGHTGKEMVSEEVTTDQDSPRRHTERRQKGATDDADREAERRARRRNPASRSVRHPSVKEPSGGTRRDRQRSVRSTETTSSKDSGESHSRRRTLHRSRDGQAEKADGKDDPNQHKSSRQDRKRSELKPRKERSERATDYDNGLRLAQSSPTESNIQTAADLPAEGLNHEPANTSEKFEARAIILPDPSLEDVSGLVSEKRSSDDPHTPQPGQGGRISDLIRKDRASKTTESPVKRNSLGKAFSDRFLAATISPGVETVSSTAAVSKLHKRVGSSDHLHLKNIASLDQGIKEKGTADEKGAVKKPPRDTSRERSGRSPRRMSRRESGSGARSPAKSTSNRERMLGNDGQSHGTRDVKDGGETAVVVDDESLEVTLEMGESHAQLLFETDARKDTNMLKASEFSKEKTPAKSPQSATKPVDMAGTEQVQNITTKTTPTESHNIEDEVPLNSQTVASLDMGTAAVTRRARQRSATSTAPRSPAKKTATASTSSDKEISTAALKSSSKSSPFTRHGNRSVSNFAEVTDLSAVPASPSNDSRSRLAQIKRRSRSPVPHQHQDMVFTWKRNAPARATIAATRRTARMAVLRQGSSRALEDNTQISDALAKAFTPGSDAPVITKREEPKNVPDALSEELREEYSRLSAELGESKARLVLSETAVLQMEKEISELQDRLDRVEQRRRG